MSYLLDKFLSARRRPIQKKGRNMGIYINPPKPKSKEQWLEIHAKPITKEKAQTFTFEKGGPVLVCMVNNGSFTAAGVAFDNHERIRFTDDGTSRPKRWYIIELPKLEGVIHEAYWKYLNGERTE